MRLMWEQDMAPDYIMQINHINKSECPFGFPQLNRIQTLLGFGLSSRYYMDHIHCISFKTKMCSILKTMAKKYKKLSYTVTSDVGHSFYIEARTEKEKEDKFIKMVNSIHGVFPSAQLYISKEGKLY
jgi:hypothetical protein